ncbi:ABC transporter permease [Sediminispirochaeta smaragdinae]|uniref:Inner-membrane translocator n=1 Tax=Sediminispirochaeta smaragdinae (strain DSM 11293 / JCM 15392 / SEBR 4228) TaxID=573413 RepID=E1R1R2_SEDSS|nr:ABC transporter permease [Sediminispirochaeta smaragdinae]ADK81438.1 inner-membrane translocator [Sediminispirochaeta smaragdinae DSM 11293]
MIEGILHEGLIYGIVALGVFITFRILDFPDLTVDGTFPFGAAIAASSIMAGAPVPVAMLLALGGGVLAGLTTAVIHNKLKVPNLLAGILTMTMLYSINIRVLGGKANVPLLHVTTAFSWVKNLSDRIGIGREYGILLFLLLVVVACIVLLDLFFHTDMGLAMGAMGDNPQMVISQGVNPEAMKMIGVGLSNGLVGVAGGLSAQFQGFADVNLGQGIVVSGLASVMIGEFLISSNKIGPLLIRVVLGSIVFKGLMYLGRYYGYYINLTPNDLKLITGLLIILSLLLSKLKHKRRRRKSA